MAGGLVGLLDDIAALAKLAAASLDDIGVAAGKASAKAAGVVVDDAAVTPRYVHGFAAERELPMIKRIAMGSLKNKLIFILPIALLLSWKLPLAIEIILMLGGTYLCFEGAEKLYEKFSKSKHEPDKPAAAVSPDTEAKMVTGAIRTDLILSGEIMVIALKEVLDERFVARALIMVVVAFFITFVVYGAVALIVKMDDFGLHLAEQDSSFSQRVGTALVKAMPGLLKWLSIIGTVAMLWVGGHILLVGTNELGWHGPYDWVHHREVDIADAVGGIGGALAWLFNTGISAIIGVFVGGVVVAVLTSLGIGHHKNSH